MAQKYYKYTVPPEMIRTARMVDLPAYIAARQGIECKQVRPGVEWSCGEGYHKLSISKERDGHYIWHRWYDGIGDDAIQYVMEYEGKSWLDAVSILYDFAGGIPVSLSQSSAPSLAMNRQEKKTQPKEFRLPPANGDDRRVRAWLTVTRRISDGVYQAFAAKKLILEEPIHHNAMFVGYDTQGIARHANLRGTSTGQRGRSFRLDQRGSDKRYSFHWVGTDENLYIFEAPVDLLSYITLNPRGWQDHSYTALCGTSTEAVEQFLADHPNIRFCHACLDNDEAGRIWNSRLVALCREKGIDCEILVPRHKDWNEDLIEGNGGTT